VLLEEVTCEHFSLFALLLFKQQIFAVLEEVVLKQLSEQVMVAVL